MNGSLDDVAGVDRESDAGDELRRVRAEEGHGIRDVTWLDPGHVREDVQRLERLTDVVLARALDVGSEQLEGRVVDDERSSDGGRTHRVHADAMWAALLGQHPHQPDYAVF